MRNNLVLISFLDFTLNLILLLAILVKLSVIKEETSQGNIESPGEFIITAEWGGNINADVDLWIKAPDNNVLFFRTKDTYPLMFLDRDDLGSSSDTFYNEYGQPINVKINREVATIKGILPGEYVVNVHLYRIWAETSGDIPVSLTLTKINPYKEVITREVILTRRDQELTAFRFTVESDGSISNTSFLFYPFVHNYLVSQ